MEFNIALEEDIKQLLPNFAGAAVYARVENTPINNELWNLIDNFSEEYRAKFTVESIKELTTIKETREAYKKCGKDPSRYRPSAEALCRRILRSVPLYQINTLVDLINLVSIKYGYSIGGFDADKIVGTQLNLGIGNKDEPYEGIGRGFINIEGMPVYRDSKGGIGTPTSDNERTKMSTNTTHLLAIINGYNGKDGLEEAANFMISLLRKFASSTEEEIVFF